MLLIYLAIFPACISGSPDRRQSRIVHIDGFRSFSVTPPSSRQRRARRRTFRVGRGHSVRWYSDPVVRWGCDRLTSHSIRPRRSVTRNTGLVIEASTRRLSLINRRFSSRIWHSSRTCSLQRSEAFRHSLERWISGWLRVLPLALAILPVSVIAERCQIARCVVSNRVHPSSLPSLAEDPLVNPALQMIPEEGWITGMLLFLVRNELQETPAAFLNRLAQPLGEISLRTLDGTRPQREGFPFHVFFADRVQLRPRYVRGLSFRCQAGDFTDAPLKGARTPNWLGLCLGLCQRILPRRVADSFRELHSRRPLRG